MLFDDLIGKRFPFYGTDGTCFKIDIYTFEAEEDTQDGYRSSLDAVRLVSPVGKIFHSSSLGDVSVMTDHGITHDYYELVGDDGHIWLRFGTDNTDDYYPYFVFTAFPKCIDEDKCGNCRIRLEKEKFNRITSFYRKNAPWRF